MDSPGLPPTAFALGSQDTARFKGKQQGSANIHSLNEQLVGRKYAEAEKTAKEMLARNPAELPAVRWWCCRGAGPS